MLLAARALTAVRCPRAMPIRALCTDHAAAARLYGLGAGASQSQIRERFLALAKSTHPDAQPAGSDCTAAFLEVRTAFDTLIAAAARDAPGATSRASAARGGGGSWGRSKSSVRWQPVRERSLGEVLCEPLRQEPALRVSVWADIRSRELELTGAMADALFRACALDGGGMPAALQILREGRGLMTPAARTEALCSLLTWCKEDELDTTFEVCDEIRDEDKTPAVLAALSSTFSYFPSGASF